MTRLQDSTGHLSRLQVLGLDECRNLQKLCHILSLPWPGCGCLACGDAHQFWSYRQQLASWQALMNYTYIAILTESEAVDYGQTKPAEDPHGNTMRWWVDNEGRPFYGWRFWLAPWPSPRKPLACWPIWRPQFCWLCEITKATKPQRAAQNRVKCKEIHIAVYISILGLWRGCPFRKEKGKNP